MKLPILSTLLLAPSLLFAQTHIKPQQSAEIRYDSRNRPVIATQVNQQGPYYMVVDTAAESSLMMPALAKQLKLESFDTGLTINGATGSMTARAFPVDSFTSELFDLSYVGLLSLPNSGSTEAAGIIGMDLFAQNALIFDVIRGQLQVAPSGQIKGRYVSLDAITDGSLLVSIMVKINGVEIPALIDTGAAVTLANFATLKALGWHSEDSKLVDDGEIRGATADTHAIKLGKVNSLALGSITLHDVPVRFTTQHDGQPASLILGSDILNNLLGFAIDFPKQQFLIKLPE